MIDFEQLKIENQTLNEKIEERNQIFEEIKSVDEVEQRQNILLTRSEYRNGICVNEASLLNQINNPEGDYDLENVAEEIELGNSLNEAENDEMDITNLADKSTYRTLKYRKKDGSFIWLES